ncbi:MAG TPA: DUF1223 domain-containing protein [Candidatus Acidoferrales bacterium]|jgi:hypothetical protein|nr:DUF1223 domain-containing protein [Candidatus Acidoferrales bacterium]
MRISSLRALLTAALLVPFVCFLALVRADSPQAPASANTDKKPVLVELFTSEGCSSCPPADALLAQLGSRQPVAGAEAIILEEHVDYWDDQGWHDPFSSAAATGRQREYAFRLGGEVYTPEMVVDGHAAFVGSDAGDARHEIQAAAAAPKADIHLDWDNSAAGGAGSSPVLRIRVGKLPATADHAKPEVFLAITESHLHSSVLRGENSGRALQHDGVVRSLARIGVTNPKGDASYDDKTTLKVNSDWKRENLRAVVFVQDPHTRRVFAAAAIPF